MRFHVGISRVVRSSSIFLGGLLVDVRSSIPRLALPSLSPPPQPLPTPPSITSIYFHFLNVAICSVTRARLGWEAVWRFHRTWSCTRWCEVTGQRWGNSGRGSSVTSGKRAGLLAALLAPGVPGMYREEKPQRKSPEPVSFIKSDKLFLTIALFLLFYNAVIWNGAPLFKHHKQVMNEPGDQPFSFFF